MSARQKNGMIIVAEHPLIAAKLSILRAKTTAPDEFRRNMQEVSILLLAEAARSWETVPLEVETPLKKSDVRFCADRS
jgi:uracil phosphoribosyltransferase